MPYKLRIKRWLRYFYQEIWQIYGRISEISWRKFNKYLPVASHRPWPHAHGDTLRERQASFSYSIARSVSLLSTNVRQTKKATSSNFIDLPDFSIRGISSSIATFTIWTYLKRVRSNLSKWVSIIQFWNKSVGKQRSGSWLFTKTLSANWNNV